MRLAVNDTEVSRALAASGRLDVDAVETSGPKVASAVEAFAGQPLLLHVPVWDWSLAHPDALADHDAWTVTEAALGATGAPWLSLHVGFSAPAVAFADGMKPAGPVLDRAATLAAMTTTVREVRARCPVPVLLENLDLQGGGAYEHVCEPAFLHELLEATEAWMLLDLAHAQVSASRLGITAEAYLEALPLERVRALHLSGPRTRDGALWDAHETLRERDRELLERVLARTRPWALTFEYGRDAEALVRQLDELRRWLGRGSGARPEG
jgi:uncharacterized protein (UPF0276 family)